MTWCLNNEESSEEGSEAEDEEVGLVTNLVPTPRSFDVVRVPKIELDEDTFGMLVCSLVRDSYFLAREKGSQIVRKLRMFTVVFLLLFTLGLQIWLLAKVKQFVSAKAVHDIRIAYGVFEKTMCGETVLLTTHGKARCEPGGFPDFEVAKARLSDLSMEEQGSICRIPLSQPVFFGAILLVWTLTCVSELRKAFHLQTVIMYMRRVKSMSEATSGCEEDDKEDGEDTGEVVVVRGLTFWMKLLVTVTCFLPRVIITVYLLWVGCRWLLGTNHFDDLILNSIALEFILLMKEGIYTALVPPQSKRARASTILDPVWKRSTLSLSDIVPNAFGLLVISLAWVFLYMYYLQEVLPGYQWDVHDVCEDYINTRFEV